MKSINESLISPQARFVLSLRITGLGDRLICLAAAWKYARDTGRVLVADWRNSIYNRSSQNLFPTCFEVDNELAGVPFVGTLDLDTAGLPRPIFPKIWEFGPLISCPWVLPTDRLEGEPDRSVAIIRETIELSEPTVVFNACINDGITSCRDAYQFLASLRPVKNVVTEVKSFLSNIDNTEKLIGLHVRHGNGGNIMGHSSSWISFKDAINRVEKSVAISRQILGADAPVLLCTDSLDVIDVLRTRITNLFYRRKEMRPSGRGELHHDVQSENNVIDALIDMVLLSKSKVLIRYPAGSFFSFYAAVMKQGPNGNVSDIHELQKPWDKEDQLSPAIIW